MEMPLTRIDRLRRPLRRVRGISAVLLPYKAGGRIDEAGFRNHVERTLKAGLGVAVNMDTGYVDLLTREEKQLVLRWAADTTGDFVAGALPGDGCKDAFAAYKRECEAIGEAGGTPLIFPSRYTASLDDPSLIGFFGEIGRASGRFIAFELGSMFSPHGRMLHDSVLRALMDLPACCGLKHSSLDRAMEFSRLELRNRMRPGFTIYSGNDLAADMIEYGSDYLLGLASFAPELFRARDQAWEHGTIEYLGLRDAIQYLGWIAFREPVRGYKHAAAIFLNLTGWLETSEPHPLAQRREPWDRELLAEAAHRLAGVCPAIMRSERHVTSQFG